MRLLLPELEVCGLFPKCSGSQASSIDRLPEKGFTEELDSPAKSGSEYKTSGPGHALFWSEPWAFERIDWPFGHKVEIYLGYEDGSSSHIVLKLFLQTDS